MKFRLFGTLALQQVDMFIQWQASCRIAVLGDSGAGKTTLLRALAGFDSSLSIETDFETKPIWQNAICYLHQHPVMFPHMSVQQSFHFASKHRQGTGQHLPFAQWAEWLEITPLLHQKSAELSGGQQQRVALLRALHSQPSLLLLDESFSSLDANMVVQACRVVDDYCRRTQAGFLLISHQDKPVRMLCDEAILVSELQSSEKTSIFEALNQWQADQLKTTLTGHCLDQDHRFLRTQVANQIVYSALPSQWQPGLARFTLDAHAISISLAERAQTSLVNRLQVTIMSHEQHDEDHFRLWLTCDDIGFWAIVSCWSWQRLGLMDQQLVFAEFKVGALEWEGQFST
jgi:ABC-type molybdate transport system ATPase subunit